MLQFCRKIFESFKCSAYVLITPDCSSLHSLESSQQAPERKNVPFLFPFSQEHLPWVGHRLAGRHTLEDRSCNQESCYLAPHWPWQGQNQASELQLWI